jgi:AraC family transcriptional regulator of adaptative response/methylated-DNA-[protein]-cysteine methyltransferase
MTADRDFEAKEEVLRYAFGVSSLASFLIARSDRGIAAIIIRERLSRDAMKRELRRRFLRVGLIYDASRLAGDVKAVKAFIEAPQQNLELPLDIRGTDFQRRVYRAVLAIPFGATTTFAAIAREIGAPKAVRAVGSACTRNPLEFAIPCHRVLRADGKWTGGGKWGDYRQAQLVKRERDATSISARRDQHNIMSGDCC